MVLPIRFVVCWTGEEKGIKKGAALRYKLQKTNAKTITPERRIRNIQSSRGGKQNRKTSETINQGLGRNDVLVMEHDVQWRSKLLL